jgi:hypothetical protein
MTQGGYCRFCAVPGHDAAVARRLVITALLIVAGGLLWWGATLQTDPLPASSLDVAVELLTPAQGAVGVIRQAAIGVDLAPGWTGDLRINGVEIPEDQLNRNDPLNQFSFQPGEGKDIASLAPGRVVATAIIWRPLQGESREQGSRRVTWEFTVS